jgi:hypothetical protein
MKKRSEKQQDLDKLKLELAKVSTVILTTFIGKESPEEFLFGLCFMVLYTRKDLMIVDGCRRHIAS